MKRISIAFLAYTLLSGCSPGAANTLVPSDHPGSPCAAESSYSPHFAPLTEGAPAQPEDKQAEDSMPGMDMGGMPGMKMGGGHHHMHGGGGE